LKKPMIIAGALVWSCAIAFSGHADTGMVDIELTVDHAQPAEKIYEAVLEKAEDICGRDTFCEEELVSALVVAIDNEAVSAVHKAKSAQPILIAASE